MRRHRALVTGASRGIGRAIATRLARERREVVAVARREESLGPLLADLGDDARFVVPLALDLADASAIRSALRDLGPVDRLVLNAGVCRQARLGDEDGDAVWREAMAVNLDAAWHVLLAVTPSMPDHGRIVAVSSGLGKLGRAGYAAYAASKHGLLGLVKSLALELAPRGITVNAVCPGWVETGMAASDLERAARISGRTSDAERSRAVERIPLGRFVDPAEVASLVGFLLSDEAAAITGEAYNISGGEFFA